ncbi:protein turtle homolog A, partial [Alosa alosa]|uniref:protein turtle homolog A n=1 Tax=Alosa alosa TaxID=278164 RepID=UPI0020152C38
MEQLRLHLLLLTVAAFTLWPLARGAEPSVRAKEGSGAVLRCSVAGADVGTASPRHVVEWVREDFDIPILIKFGAYAPRVHPDYEGRVSLLGDSALSVETLRLEDQGRYECRILPLEQTNEETRNGSWTLLSVYAAPIFTETPPPVVEALLGKPLTLRCVVRGNPTPRVTWAKNGVLLKQNKTEVRNGTVSFRSVTREAAGEYRCDAFNSEGNVSHVTRLSVKGPPVIRIPPKDLVLNISQGAALLCKAEADPPNMTYVWQKEGENIYHIQSLKSRVKVLVDGTLQISRLTPEDSGNYTCTPTNGLLTPPSASASLTVRHPAQVLNMPRETYLPTGMGGAIPCPVRAEPPLLRVDWTKDGKPLDLDTYPGWTLTSQGSVVMATASEDAAGVYTCTPYNVYGTMGESEPTRVILQDPPSFKVSPRKEYRQEVARMLVIPCEAAGDPAPRVTWSKVGRSPSSPFSMAPNGSLVLRSLNKDHQGAWECSAANRVATVNVSTTVLVLGTSPHAVPLLSISAGLTHANVSWEPGFDGGYTQKFTIWLKRASSEADVEKQEWASVPVPPSAGTSLRVTGLLPSTDYQFSVLPQNKMGTGPFSDIATARTLDPQPVVKELAPPTFLSANVTSGGVVIRWKPPRGQSPPVESFLLQSRLEGGQWANLVEGINANRTHMVLQDLSKDRVYELRLLSQRGDECSGPSASRNISTAGLEASVSPASRGMQQVVAEPLLAGLVGGLGLLCVALLLTIGTACVYRRRNARRKRRRDDLTPALLASPSAIASAAGGSPDSVLKHQLLPPHSHFSSYSSSPSSSPCDPASLERSSQADYRSPQQGSRSSTSRALPPLPESTLHRAGGPLSPLSPLELISRGPDGRFSLDPSALETLEETPFSRTPVRRSLQADFSRCPSSARGGPQRSHSLRSNREERRDRQRGMDRDGMLALKLLSA